MKGGCLGRLLAMSINQGRTEMAERHDQQGTGRHPHKDTQEPWPHTKDNEGGHGRADESRHSQSRDQGSPVGGSHDGGHDREEEADLKRREYRGEDGEIHHHTKTYMEQHQGESQSGGGKNESHSGGSRNESHSSGSRNESHSGGSRNESHSGGSRNESHSSGSRNESHSSGSRNESHSGGSRSEHGGSHSGGQRRDR
jgi:hypothetical protein